MTHLFLSPYNTFIALLSGIIFGFLLRKATVSRFDTIVGQLLLKDFTVMKVILTAIVVGSIGIYSLNEFGIISTFHFSKIPVVFTLIGGIVFGVGMSIAGYCPGTAVAAIADGSKDMIVGVLGMFCGAAVFNECSSFLLPYMQQKDFMFEKTLSSLFNVSNWMIIFCLIGIWIIFFLGVKKLEEKNQSMKTN